MTNAVSRLRITISAACASALLLSPTGPAWGGNQNARNMQFKASFLVPANSGKATHTVQSALIESYEALSHAAEMVEDGKRLNKTRKGGNGLFDDGAIAEGAAMGRSTFPALKRHIQNQLQIVAGVPVGTSRETRQEVRSLTALLEVMVGQGAPSIARVLEKGLRSEKQKGRVIKLKPQFHRVLTNACNARYKTRRTGSLRAPKGRL